jgi:hypothetical protein
LPALLPSIQSGGTHKRAKICFLLQRTCWSCDTTFLEILTDESYREAVARGVAEEFLFTLAI